MPRNSICIKMGKRLSFHVLKWCCTRSHPPPSPHPPTHIHTHKHQVWDNYHKKEDLDSVRPHIYDLLKKKGCIKISIEIKFAKGQSRLFPSAHSSTRHTVNAHPNMPNHSDVAGKHQTSYQPDVSQHMYTIYIHSSCSWSKQIAVHDYTEPTSSM